MAVVLRVMAVVAAAAVLVAIGTRVPRNSQVPLLPTSLPLPRRFVNRSPQLRVALQLISSFPRLCITSAYRCMALRSRCRMCVSTGRVLDRVCQYYE